MEQAKPRVKVFTRSKELCGKLAKDKPLMHKWYKDLTLTPATSHYQTQAQKNYFYEYRD